MIEHLKSLLFGDDASTGTALDEVRLAAAALMVEAAMMDGCMDERNGRISAYYCGTASNCQATRPRRCWSALSPCRKIRSSCSR